MPVIVKKWGNSAAIRIPSGVMRAAHLNLESAVDVREQSGRIVIEPIRDDEINLNQMIAAITPENAHGAADFGGPIGKELL